MALELKSLKQTRCPAHGLIVNSLGRASRLLLEFVDCDIGVSLRKQLQFRSSVKECGSLRDEWRDYGEYLTRSFELHEKNKQYGSRSLRRKYCFKSMLKSCNRLFDVKCGPCDRREGNKVRAAWINNMTKLEECVVGRPTEGLPDPIGTLKARVRELVGDQWAEERKVDEVYVPDQQGCLENKRATGGTLGVKRSESLGVSKANWVRVGTAKTKGKVRVVTMQPAWVKHVLSRPHNLLYDHITKFGWCVRGDLQVADLMVIQQDRRVGEVFISGDYRSATDNLHQDAVKAVVDVLCESKHLTTIERDTLRESFSDILISRGAGQGRTVLKGSMMGNLCSFPILCLLNKACFDIACDLVGNDKQGTNRGRKVRINGDDIAFAGDERMYGAWRHVTSLFGFVVNEEKTGRSARFIELNSRVFDTTSGSFCVKPTLGFLRVEKKPSDLLYAAWEGMKGLDLRLFALVVHMLKYEIMLRPIGLTQYGKKFCSRLLRLKWVRDALRRGPAPVVTKGVERSIPMVVSRPPRARYYELVSRLSRDVTVDFVSQWEGEKVEPSEQRIDRQSFKSKYGNTIPPSRVEVSSPQWAFVWPAPVYTFLRECMDLDLLLLPAESCKNLNWVEDHLFLTRRCEVSFADVREGDYRSVPQPVSLFDPLSDLSGCVGWRKFFGL